MMPASPARKPRVFSPDDPALGPSSPPHGFDGPPVAANPGVPPAAAPPPAPANLRQGLRWGAVFLSAMAALTALAASLAFTRFVSDAIARNDWVGWLATGLLSVMTVSAAVIVLRELIGLVRLSRLSHLRRDVLAALRQRDTKAERLVVGELSRHFAGRADMAWGLARLKDHESDVRDPGELLALADRELIAPLDNEARRIVLKSAKRVSLVTALMPMVWMAMLFVLVENLRLLRALAGLYGGRPGFLGSFRLARMVMTHIIATGGLALTDDLLGQFLGQDLLRRLSRRLGEGVFNGALTARIGTAAIEVTRPLPYIEAVPVRIRDLLPEIFRRPATTSPPPAA
jgi:putative membrane protein